MGKLPQALPRAFLRTLHQEIFFRTSLSHCTNVSLSNDRTLASIPASSQRYQHSNGFPSLAYRRASTAGIFTPAAYTSSLLTRRSLLETRNMSSDADYASFLDKANQATGSVEQQSTSKKSYGTKSVNTAVPKTLEQVEEYYISDADEPFEPVALQFDGSNVSAGM